MVIDYHCVDGYGIKFLTKFQTNTNTIKTRVVGDYLRCTNETMVAVGGGSGVVGYA